MLNKKNQDDAREIKGLKIERGRRAAELVVANKELAFQQGEKGKRAAELVIIQKLAVQSEELKKINGFMIDREMKMIGLKKEIVDLKQVIIELRDEVVELKKNLKI